MKTENPVKAGSAATRSDRIQPVEESGRYTSLCSRLSSLPPDLSALEASLATLEPLSSRSESVKANALMRLVESTPPLTGEKLIETIVKTGDQEITLSLREYVKSARLVAGLYGSAVGILIGLLLGIGLMLLIDMKAESAATRSDRIYLPLDTYFVNDVVK